VRAAKSLHQKKHRLEQRCFLVEGPTAVETALDASGVEIERVFVDADATTPTTIAAKAAARSVDLIAVDERTMRSLSETRTPQGVVAVARFFHKEPARLPDLAGDGSQPSTVLVLHDVGDPGNAGTLFRSAEAFGAAAVCCSTGGVDPYNEKVARASLGSMFHVPLVLYGRWAELAEGLRAARLAVVAADAGAPDVRTVTLPKNVALVVGNERRGVASLPADAVAVRIGIPQSARTESLNAAVAGSIALYEIARANGTLPTSRAARTSDA